MSKKIINRNALLNNVKILKEKAGNKLFCAVVKANAYGHGIKTVVGALNNVVDYFAVSSVLEAEEVIKLNVVKPVLVLSKVIKFKILKNVEYCICTIKELRELQKLKKQVFVHIKINCGMNRFGCNLQQARKLINFINSSKTIKLKGIFTHFSFAENDEILKKQNTIFQEIINQLNLPSFVIIHASNTLATIKGYKYDMCRCGLGIYGFGSKDLQPIMKIKSEIMQVRSVKRGEMVGYGCAFVAKKNMKIAIIKIGYADGFEMQFNFGVVIIKRKKCKIIGNVCMDYLFCDVSNIKNLRSGNWALVISKRFSIDFISKKVGKIPYEIVCGFNKMR